MSLSNALSNAMSGLAAASRGTEVVASNLANALTPGFARREMQLSPRPHIAGGGGVHVDGVTRLVRASVLAQTRIAGAETARAGTLAAFHTGLEGAYGIPGQPGALTTRLADFDAALIAAAGRPESETHKARIVSTAQALTGAINQIADGIQQARGTADQAIAADVDRLNQGLTRIADLNRKIAVQLASGDDATALQDARQTEIDAVAQIVPVQELPREGGRVALFSASGAVLLDGSQPVTVGFAAAGPITPQMAAGTPPLSRLTLDGVELTPGQMRLYGGGRMAANFAIRDDQAPQAQARLDALARDLHDRFADPAVDPTRAAGQPALLTDGGQLATAGSEVGLAGRLRLNAAVQPDRGGALWRLRDGLGAAAPGPAGDSALLGGMSQALAGARTPASATLSPVARTAAALAGELTSIAASDRLAAESVQTAAGARSGTFQSMMLADGVDSDREMENLLQLERAYASNAKVLLAVDEMLQTILRMT
ncbi:flagellar hook-associated protein FlgK [Paracoccus luteus]|uniref:flagellar hook-associated protein FlgK n=1 Tax=Paracoccus luteus TaxID=2508543 RepID=UPI00142F84FF|nr:flagellar hook-associated protein FlgK [Paracoccus luteus]